MSFLLGVGFTFLLVPTVLYSQDSTAILKIDEARTLYKTKDYVPSLQMYQELIDHFKSEESWEHWEQCYAGIWLCYYRMDNKEATLDSLPLLIDDLPEDDHLLRAKCMYRRGWTLQLFGLIYISNQVFEETLAEVNKVPSSKDSLSRKTKLSTLRYLGNTYSQLGDNNTAIKYSQEGYRYAESVKDTVKMQEFLALYGKYSFHNGETLEAIDAYKKFLNLFPPEIYLHQYLAEAYLYADSLDQAKAQLDNARAMMEPDEQDYLQLSNESLYNLKRGNLDKAMELKKQHLDVLRNSFKSRTLIKELVMYAQYLFEDQQYENGVKVVHEAMRKFDSSLDSLDVKDRLEIDYNMLPDIHIMEALYLKAKYYNRLFSLTNEGQYLDEASYYYETLIQLFDKLKSTYRSQNSQYRIGGYTQKFYAEAISFFAQLYSHSKDVSYFEKALKLAQNANAYVLKNSIGERKRFELAGISSDSINHFYHLKSKVNENDSTAAVSKQVNDLNAYVAALRKNYPSIDKYDDDHEINLTSIQKALHQGQLLVKYFFNDSLLFRFTISSSNYSLSQIILPADFEKRVESIQKMSSDPDKWDETDYGQSTKYIFDLLLTESLNHHKKENINHLIIAPDGPLKGLSFSALVTNKLDENITPEDYLIYDFEVSYLYYCAQLEHQESSAQRKRFIGFGLEYQDPFLEKTVDEYIQNNRSADSERQIILTSLKYAIEEVDAISTIFKGDALFNNEVTVSKVIDIIGAYKVGHFSAHAFMNEENYLNSFIALSEDDSGNFKLKYSDIVNLELDSEMTVLSACQTVSGTNLTGEGLMGLSRAFIQSGCQSTVGSYWNVPDKVTSELMQLFYTNLNQGMTKSDALRQAQMNYLTTASQDSKLKTLPFYWSSWAIYGKTHPLTDNSLINLSLQNTMLLIGFILMIVLLLKWYLSRRK